MTDNQVLKLWHTIVYIEYIRDHKTAKKWIELSKKRNGRQKK